MRQGHSSDPDELRLRRNLPSDIRTGRLARQPRQTEAWHISCCFGLRTMARQNPSYRGQCTLPPGGQDHETANVPAQPRVRRDPPRRNSICRSCRPLTAGTMIVPSEPSTRRSAMADSGRMLTLLGWALYKEGDLPPAVHGTARSRKNDDLAPSNGALTARVDAGKRASAKKDGPPPRFVGKKLRCRAGGRVVTRPAGRHNFASYRDV